MVNQNVQEKIVFLIFRLATTISLLILGFILFYTLINGISVININFLTKSWTHSNISQGGVFQAILGTILLGIGVIIFAIPVGIITAIYLNEYAKDTKFTRIIKLSIRNLAGVPSIIYGLFGLSLFVLLLKFNTSLIAACLTLSCMTLPWIITASDEALKSIPFSFREGSYALGATKWQTIRRNVLPHSASGMITGSILGISRAIGETAPIILVGATFYLSYLSVNPFDKFLALPYHLFILSTQHASHLAIQYAWGIALILFVTVFLLNIGVFIVRYNLRKQKKW